MSFFGRIYKMWKSALSMWGFFRPKQNAWIHPSTVEGFQPDDMIDGRYRVLELLGKGGMGIVYKVQDCLPPNRLFALKILLPEKIKKIQSNEALLSDLRKRFIDEASLCMKLDHPNIVKVKGVHRSEDQVYLFMEYIEGNDLSKWLSEHSSELVEKRWEIISDACKALEYAHKQQIYHRDIKPTNIMVADSGQSLIVDFGLAKPMEQELRKLSRDGIGSPAYAAPEQLEGKFYDHRVDIYSLGIVCIEIFIGRYPGNPVEANILDELHGRTSEQIATVLKKATEVAPSDRYENIPRMFSDFEKAIKSTFFRPHEAVRGNAPVTSIVPERHPDPASQTSPIQITSTLPKPPMRQNFIWFIVAVLGTTVLVSAIVFFIKKPFEIGRTGLRIGEYKVISLDTGEFLHPVRNIFLLTPGERILIHAEVDIKPDDQPIAVFFDAVFGAINAEASLAAQYRAPAALHTKDLIIIEASNDVEHYRKALGIDIRAQDKNLKKGDDQEQWKGDTLQ